MELEIGILLPVAEEEWEFQQEAVVGVAKGRKRIRARVTVQTALESLACANQLLPGIVVVGISFLQWGDEFVSILRLRKS